MLALIVDDSRAMRKILARTLSAVGLTTVEADDGRTGLEMLRAMPVPPDVVLVDWNMPEVDGLEFVAAVRAQPAWRTVRIMMVTNESKQTNIVRALAAGAHDYLVKPFTAAVMHDRLSQLDLVTDGKPNRTQANGGPPNPNNPVSNPPSGPPAATRPGSDADGSEPRTCNCCAVAGTVAYYPLDEPLEQGDDEPLPSVDRIYVCERCFQLVEAGRWSRLRGWVGSATDRRAVRHLWLGLRRHLVGTPVPSFPASILIQA